MRPRSALAALVFLIPALGSAQPAPAPEQPASDAPEVTVAGYVETYYQLNVRTPSNRITNLRGFDNRDRAFTLSNVALDAKGERGPLAVRLILQVGSTGSTYYLAEPALAGSGGANATGPELWKYVQQATLAYQARHDLLIEAGLFLSPVGPEVIPVKDNALWSRSNLFFGLPAYHTGARVSRPLGGAWTGTAAIYSGWNSVVDSNRYPSVALSAAYASDSVNGQLLYFGGIERATGAPEGKPWRNLLDAYVTLAVSDDATVLLHGDGGLEWNDFGTSGWLAGQAQLKLQLAPKLYAAVRGDYFREWVAQDRGMSASAIFWPTEWVASGTATLAVQPTDGLSVRLEYRHDHAPDDVFFGDDVEGDGVLVPYIPNRELQDTVTLGAVAWF